MDPIGSWLHLSDLEQLRMGPQGAMGVLLGRVWVSQAFGLDQIQTNGCLKLFGSLLLAGKTATMEIDHHFYGRRLYSFYFCKSSGLSDDEYCMRTRLCQTDGPSLQLEKTPQGSAMA